MKLTQAITLRVKRPRITRRNLFRTAVFAVGAFAALPAIEWKSAVAQDELEGMTGSHPVGIENDTQHKLFFSLICMCGCPRETLGTCQCDFAHNRRSELKAALAAGKTVEELQDAYAARFGVKALAVPRDQGANRLLWAFPLVAIVAGAVGLILVLRRWRDRGQAAPIAAAPAAAATPAPPDDYDDKLDQELKELDR